jgi:hypothetical protein
MTGDTQERDQAVLMERITGATLREIAVRYDLSVEGARYVSDKAARQHITKLVADMLACQAEGQLLVLAVPATSDEEQALVIRYLDWLLSQFADIPDFKIKVHYRPTPTGAIAFGLEAITVNAPEEVAQP